MLNHLEMAIATSIVAIVASRRQNTDDHEKIQGMYMCRTCMATNRPTKEKERLTE